MFRIGLLLLVLILAGCASSSKTMPEYKTLGIDEDQITVHDCIYDAIDQAVRTGQVAWWNSGPYNCIMKDWYRGRILLKQIETSTKYICAEFFEHSQIKPKKESWFDYQDLTFAACKLKKGGQWRLDYDSDILDYIVLQDLLHN